VSIEARWEDLAGQMATSLETLRQAWEAA
jgi:hypothetical protein